MVELATKLAESSKHATIEIQSVITPERKVAEGVLIRCASIMWARIVEELERDWTQAYKIPSGRWEEMVAGAFSKANFDEVILTPRSGDLGRDVIAIRRGVGCVKVLGSVKAYKPGHLVKHDDVRALLGVLSAEQDASKGMIVTTSDFAPTLATDRLLKPLMPSRIELLNGTGLREWLVALAKKYR
jgi:restriction system protein